MLLITTPFGPFDVASWHLQRRSPTNPGHTWGTFEDSLSINTRSSIRQNSHELWEPYWVISVKKRRLSQVTRDKSLITQRQVKRRISKNILCALTLGYTEPRASGRARGAAVASPPRPFDLSVHQHLSLWTSLLKLLILHLAVKGFTLAPAPHGLPVLAHPEIVVSLCVPHCRFPREKTWLLLFFLNQNTPDLGHWV